MNQENGARLDFPGFSGQIENKDRHYSPTMRNEGVGLVLRWFFFDLKGGSE
jgi:hypothetical protein